MIGRLKGTLLEKSPPHLLLDVSGVAYEISAPMFTFYRLPEIGEEVLLHTHLVVREDAHQLFGFSQKHERKLFRSLIKVSAVGPKLALSILSGIEPLHFINCVEHNDVASLVNIPGVGKKTAERLIVEMKDRLSDWEEGATTGASSTGYVKQQAISPKKEAISALVALGYKANDAKRTVECIKESDGSSEHLIRLALQNMVARK